MEYSEFMEIIDKDKIEYGEE